MCKIDMAVFLNFEILFNYVPKMLDRNLEFFFFCVSVDNLYNYHQIHHNHQAACT